MGLVVMEIVIVLAGTGCSGGNGDNVCSGGNVEDGYHSDDGGDVAQIPLFKDGTG